MAIDKIKKAVIFIPNSIFEKFIVELKLLSAVEIISQEETTAKQQILFNITPQEVKQCVTKIDSAVNILNKYLEFEINKSNIVIDFSKEDIKSVITTCTSICEKIEKIDAEIKKSQQELNKLYNQHEIFSNFSTLEINFLLLKKIKTVIPYFLHIDIKNEKKFLSELAKLNLATILWKNKTKNLVYMFIVVYKDINNLFLDIAKKYEISFYDLISISSKDDLAQQISFLSTQITSYKNKISEYVTELKNIYTTQIDFIYKTYLLCLELTDFFAVPTGNAKFVRIITCWVPQKYLTKLQQLCKKFKEVSIIFFDPYKDEDVPTVLYNKPSVEPYEFITTLYGYPKIGTVDPTELLAPFFTLFFALCLSDIFYGFLLIVLWLMLKNKINKNSQYYKFVLLFKYLGLTSVVVGVFLDSFLGISIFKNFKLPMNLTLFDPLNRPIDMLKFTFLLGYAQIVFGLAINAVKSYKESDILSMIDNISWIVFITTFAPFVYKLFFPKELPVQLIKVSTKISFAVFLFIVIFQSRNIKNVLLKPVTIFVKAYNVIGFYADILSYSRILALALASCAISQTVNIFVVKLFHAQLFGIKYIEPILAPIVFVGGHVFNFVMSMLSGMVHSARLQYLEFFSKFFVSGGRPIKLFSPRV